MSPAPVLDSEPLLRPEPEPEPLDAVDDRAEADAPFDVPAVLAVLDAAGFDAAEAAADVDPDAFAVDAVDALVVAVESAADFDAAELSALAACEAVALTLDELSALAAA